MSKKSEEKINDLIDGGSAADVEDFLGFQPGTFDHIPHYARGEALSALLHVREMERRNVFRPGLYYAVLSDLCRATEASLILGNNISQKRIETFILTCVDALGHIETTNYHLFLREIGDAVLLLFSSFEDAHQWWMTMNSWLDGRDGLWSMELDMTRAERRHFKLECKTIIHAGEVGYSGTNVPVSAAVNQVFKVEKLFKPNELGLTQAALTCAKPILRSLKLQPTFRGKVTLPGDKDSMGVFVVNNYQKVLRAHQRRAKKIIEAEKRQQCKSSVWGKPSR